MKVTKMDSSKLHSTLAAAFDVVSNGKLYSLQIRKGKLKKDKVLLICKTDTQSTGKPVWSYHDSLSQVESRVSGLRGITAMLSEVN